MQDQQ